MIYNTCLNSPPVNVDTMNQLIDLLQPVMTGACGEYDPRSPQHDAQVREIADQLVESCSGVEQLDALEAQLSADAPLFVQIAVKLSRSKALIRRVDAPPHVSIVFAVYKEHTRILPADQHPHGEDFIARKIAQIKWLLDDSATVSWSMWIVDDGCPENSGQLAQQILSQRFPNEPAQVLFLDNAIQNDIPITRPMKSSAESQKGGSIVYGMWTAVQTNHDRQIVVFTDADLSTHLGQVGLLVDGITAQGMDAAIGSRREPTSVVVKQGQRNTRGKLFIYLWKSMMAPLHYITDTQCGFKAFTADTIRDIAEDLLEKRFAFDIELLLKTELRRSGSICKIPVAWIDSEAASTTTGIQPYLSMLQSVAAMYRKYLPPDPDADAFADLIESMTEAQWQQLSDRVPAAIADADPASFDRDRPVSVSDLKNLL